MKSAMTADEITAQYRKKFDADASEAELLSTLTMLEIDGFLESCAGGKYRLRKALDETKDQSYVLYAMTQEQLAHTLFPLGALRKTQTREIAEACGFVNARKPDSQDICFVPDGDYAKIIERFTGAPCPSGDFISPDGTVLGLHGGIIRYTIGQHRGLGLDLPEKRYVCRICPRRRQRNWRAMLASRSSLSPT